jgi:uncharacterized repeat protein (TIGR01451 family)
VGDLDADGDVDAVIQRVVKSQDNRRTGVWLNVDAGDLAFQKTASQSAIMPGERLTYTIALSLSAISPIGATGIVITDEIPSALTDIYYASSGIEITPTGGISHVWQVSNLTPGTSGAITVAGSVHTGLPAGYVFTNTAIIRTDQQEPDSTTSGVAVVTILNAPPIAADDRGATDEDHILWVRAPGVLANDSDANGDPLSVFNYDRASALGVPIGILALGTYQYDPITPVIQSLDVGDIVVDTFSYTVIDCGNLTDTATVSITVTGLNDEPALTRPIPNRHAARDVRFHYTVPADTFWEPDAHDTLTYTATRDDGSPLPAWLHFSPTTRTFSGVPSAPDVGRTALCVTATDGSGASATDSFTITVDDLSVAAYALPPSRTAFCPGWNVDYVLELTNTLTITLTDLIITDTLPANTCCATAGDESTIPGLFDAQANAVVWRVARVEPGASVRVHLAGLHPYSSLNSGDVLTNTFTYTAKPLVHVGAASVGLVADRTLCGLTLTPTPTRTRTPTPTPSRTATIYPEPTATRTPTPSPTPSSAPGMWFPLIRQ